MSARIEVQAPIRRSMRGFLWALAVLLFVLAALAIWNMKPGSGTATKTGTTTPVTTSVTSPQSDEVAARYRELAKASPALTGNAAQAQARYRAQASNGPATGGGSRAGRGSGPADPRPVATSPQQL